MWQGAWVPRPWEEAWKPAGGARDAVFMQRWSCCMCTNKFSHFCKPMCGCCNVTGRFCKNELTPWEPYSLS